MGSTRCIVSTLPLRVTQWHDDPMTGNIADHHRTWLAWVGTENVYGRRVSYTYLPAWNVKNDQAIVKVTWQVRLVVRLLDSGKCVKFNDLVTMAPTTDPFRVLDGL